MNSIFNKRCEICHRLYSHIPFNCFKTQQIRYSNLLNLTSVLIFLLVFSMQGRTCGFQLLCDSLLLLAEIKDVSHVVCSVPIVFSTCASWNESQMSTEEPLNLFSRVF